MLVEKKFLTQEYLGHLCIGLIRYDPFDKKNKSLIAIGNFLNYFFSTKSNPYSVLSKVYDSDNLVYLQIFSFLISFKLSDPSMDMGMIKQELVNRLENSIDANSFNKANKFIQCLVDHLQADRFNNAHINEEFDRCLKYIVLNDSINSLANLYKGFYEKEDSYKHYEKTLSQIFTNYEESIIEDDFILDVGEEEIGQALEESALVQEEVRPVQIFNELRFLEKKRVAIIIGASGSGKSMLLCHTCAEYLRNIKDDNDKKKIVFYFTFENSKAETFIRIMANMLEIEIDNLKANMRNPKYKKQVVERFLSAKEKNTVLVISELPPKRHNITTLEAIVDKTLLRYKDGEVYSIICDYADKMLPVTSNSKLRTDESLGLIIDDAKAVSKKYDTAYITVSQFNRTGNQKAKSDDEMASATDIGGGWSKYENADVVITMQVKNTYEELGYNTCIFINEKHRYYRDGTVIDAIYKPQFAKYYTGSVEHGGMMAGRFKKTEKQLEKDVYEQTTIF